ncbi:MAG: hypothetical protein R3B13_04995 [Polyangiaceae bacterium]
MIGAWVGARLVLARLRSRTLFSLGAAGMLSVAIIALLERRTGSPLAVDRTLAGAALGLALPLLALAVTRTITGRQSLVGIAFPLARHGHSRREITLGLWITSAGASALIGATLAALAVLIVRLPADPLLLRDALTSTWIGALAGATYGSLFTFGASFGRHGGGAYLLLGLDLALGTGTGLSAAFLPRAHVRNLLGGAPPLELPQLASTVLLLASILLLAAWTSRRTPR